MPEHPFIDIAEIAVDRRRARVYEHGWQSWSPSTTYAVTDRPHRPVREAVRVMNYRADAVAPVDAFQGEGLLAVDPDDGAPVHVLATRDAAAGVPSLRATLRGDRLVVSTDAPDDEVVVHSLDDGGGGIEGALGRWGTSYAGLHGVEPPRPAPTTWCSWYHYFTRVTEADIDENVAAIDELDLPVDVVQLDDGYQAEVGDWLELSGRFASLEGMADRIRGRGRRAGIWVAPFLVGARSRLAAEHPDWLVRSADGMAPAWAGRNWQQDVYGLDTTHPEAVAYLHEVFATLTARGFDFFKVDFVYAAALEGRRHEDVPGVTAYRRGLRVLREAIGPEAYLLGCGAPILPSVGLVDGMRVSPDVAPEYEPEDGDLSQPSQRAAALTGAARAWQHGRFWVNDPDCLIARPAVERREAWAAHVERYGGLRSSSDRLRDLDGWGLETTRRLLSEVPPPTPFG